MLRLRRLLDRLTERGDFEWRPTLESGEHILLEGVAGDKRGQFGGNWGKLILTNQRVIWRESGEVWPKKMRSAFTVRLSELTSIGKTTPVSYIFWGHRLQLRKRLGKAHRLVEDLDLWIDAIRAAKDADSRGIEL